MACQHQAIFSLDCRHQQHHGFCRNGIPSSQEFGTHTIAALQRRGNTTLTIITTMMALLKALEEMIASSCILFGNFNGLGRESLVPCKGPVEREAMQVAFHMNLALETTCDKCVGPPGAFLIGFGVGFGAQSRQARSF